VTADRVVEAVRPYGLTLDTQNITEVVVACAGHVIPVKDVKAALARALTGRLSVAAPEDLSFTSDMKLRPLHLRPSVSTELEPRQITFDRRSGRFDITLYAVRRRHVLARPHVPLHRPRNRNPRCSHRGRAGRAR
jgi:hypothetical protein